MNGSSRKLRRVEGFRRDEILNAALDVLLAVGYDCLTMDSVAAKAQTSKATLYRHWGSKGQLVIEAVTQSRTSVSVPDTGSLAGDLTALFTHAAGLLDPRSIAILGAVATALANDQRFSAELRSAFIAPRVDATRRIWTRAAVRGDLRDGLDLDVIEQVLGGIVMSQVLLMGNDVSVSFVARAIDQVIVPAATRWQE